ncbi:NAD(P)/FAD-dependent oxidoreductase [Salinispora arenicola]|uniref:NAD(P)/FAD-dependent oxidoreductase n=1 Tax=Salinispora arenicola TaxID=168697 RepID=UPI0003A49DD8|nr:FAD-dependent oxidoreductase [Salinispora arenicola]
MEADISVVGAGIIGAAVAARLTSAGHRVLILDLGSPEGRRATTLSGGMVRAYDPDPVTMELATTSLRIYGDPDRWPARNRPLEMVGALTVAAQTETDTLHHAAGVLSSAGLAGVGVTTSTVRGVDLAGGVALVEPSAGYVDPAAVTASWLTQVQQAGGSVRHRMTVHEVVSGPGGVTLSTDEGAIRVSAAVLATGAWHPPPIRAGGTPVGAPARRARSIQVATVRHEAMDLPTLVDLRTGAYLRPISAISSIIGAPHLRWDVDPTGTVEADARHVRNIVELLTPSLPWLEQASLDRVICGFDGYAPQAQPMHHLDPTGRVVVVRPFNGGGVRVAPAAGAAVAEALSRQLSVLS